MNEQKTTLTADRVQAEYEKGVQYNTGIGLYENVKQCENFVEGKQWEGLKSKKLASDHDERTGSDRALQGGADRLQRCGSGG